MTAVARIARGWEALDAVPDPEIPVVSIRDLGILRDVRLAEDGETIEAVITPTYSGCPAMSQIEEDVGRALDAAGLRPWRVLTVLAPAWTTDWITALGQARLREYGIAPPHAAAGHAAGDVRPLRFVPRGGRAQTMPDAVTTSLATSVTTSTAAATAAATAVACPRCGSLHTEELARFASTACKALYRCLACREPFDYFKPY
ncbi:1,2-phenylacetyl-CoA epoxidase subunit PaaD [Cupriavidus plantarum]|uniref:1,2-phenylacetyl-CoA epoxidase subunit PaaD n=1 Tax=Cupriavidus plantarum TaxID=942865 RepID=UPI000EB489FB|nr:1,2-phenylacetyl-CoA epoxidase subunit PaaD [Cupriavidus plantarum]RLK29206.1 ring-1,2-phenylacetyl-CoA epoxidase subunit PaaD [Cupriavidus plantarum]